MVKVGDFVRTCNGRKGVVVKVYKTTDGTEYCYIREIKGQIYRCPTSYII